MNIRKNFEAVFLAAVAVAAFTSYAAAKVPAFQPAKAVQAAPLAAAATMHTVVVTAPRLTAAEKAALN